MQGLLKSVRRLEGLTTDQRGAVAPLIGLLLLPIMMSMGLVIDGGLLFYNQRLARNAADAAAYEGAKVLYQLKLLPTPITVTDPATSYSCTGVPWGGDANPNVIDTKWDVVNRACNVATSAPYTYPAPQVAVEMTPVSGGGPFVGSPSKVQVVITRPYDTLIIRLLGPDQVTINAPAVGGLTNSSPAYAIYILSQDPNNCEAFLVPGGQTVNVTGGIKVDSPCDGPPGQDAVRNLGTINVTGPFGGPGPFDVVGDAGGGGTYNCTGGTPCPNDNGGTTPTGDPLAGVPEVVQHWCDADGDVGNGKESAVLRILDPDPPGLDPRFLTGGATNIFNNVACGGVGSTNGVLKLPNFAPWGSPVLSLPDDPAGFSACDAPDDPGLPGLHDLKPGVYWGGIQLPSSCPNPTTLYFDTGVYVLAGNNDNDPSLDLKAGNDVAVTSGQILIYVTDDPYADDSDKRRGAEVDLNNTGAAGAMFQLGAAPQPSPSCPGSTSYRGILLMEDRDGPQGTSGDEDSNFYGTNLVGAHPGTPPDDITSTTDNGRNNVSIQGGGHLDFNLSGALYSRDGLLEMQGGYTVDNSMLIFKYMAAQMSEDSGVSGQQCTGLGPLPRLMR